MRNNPEALDGTTHNVFGIQVGVRISFFLSRMAARQIPKARMDYARVDEFWRKEEKFYRYLDERNTTEISNGSR